MENISPLPASPIIFDQEKYKYNLFKKNYLRNRKANLIRNWNYKQNVTALMMPTPCVTTLQMYVTQVYIKLNKVQELGDFFIFYFFNVTWKCFWIMNLNSSGYVCSEYNPLNNSIMKF